MKEVCKKDKNLVVDMIHCARTCWIGQLSLVYSRDTNRLFKKLDLSRNIRDKILSGKIKLMEAEG